MRKRPLAAVVAILFVALPGCAAPQDNPAPAQTTAVTPSNTNGGAPMTTNRVRFSAGDAAITVRLADNPTSRDFASKLPLTLTFEDFAGKEKISYLPARLTTDGSPGSAPANGNLIYYKPWGNIGFYYNADGGHDDNLITVGTVEAGMEHLNRLEQGQVIVEAVN